MLNMKWEIVYIRPILKYDTVSTKTINNIFQMQLVTETQHHLRIENMVLMVVINNSYTYQHPGSMQVPKYEVLKLCDDK